MFERVGSVLLMSMALTLPAFAQREGVTLHTGTDRDGARQLFVRDEPDLSRTRFGAGRARSITVPRGCVATLYTRPNFRGRRVEVRDDDNDLGNTPVGYDTASLTVSCGGGYRDRDRDGDREGGYRRHERDESRGVTLFRDRDLEGTSDTFDGDVPDLSRTRIGNRRASSIRVPRGCVATLYQGTNYRGRSTTFRDDDNNLKNTSVGEDTVSSLRVRCEGDGREGRIEVEGGIVGGVPPSGPGVTLFRDRDLEGDGETFARDVPDLAGTRIGARRASSIRVPRGCTAVLYELPGYQGRRTEFHDDDNNLKNTEVGEDTASSLQVDCGRR
ncbi:MAG TPA: beta/gamma crystallin-related protein [Thermoanaerobaculia bacterium]|nr:beta/gamma crystallin-related protein [Thermoanaerobaculia bacterium]